MIIVKKELNFKLLIVCWLLLVSSACTVGPDFERPTPPNVKQYTHDNIESQPNPSGDIQFEYSAKIPKQWWQLFNSKQLNKLVEEALKNNNTLVAARASLNQAQQTLSAVSGSQLPQVDGNANVTPQRLAPSIYGIDNVPTTDFLLYTASVNISYNLDLFGGLKRQVEAYGALAEYEAYQMAGAQLTLTTNITNTVFKLALLNEEVDNVHAVINAQESLVLIAQKQLLLGGIGQMEINELEKNLLQTKNSLTGLLKSREQAKNQLAIYLGKAPSNIQETDFKLNDFAMVKKVPLIVPSNLARQRPDILAAEALLHQASAGVGIATANMYPQFNITGSIGQIATQNDMQGLLGQSWIWSFGPNMVLPLFHGGALNSQRKAAIAGFDNALANYKQTVLQGLQDVANCLSALDQDSKALNFQDKYYATSYQNLKIIEQQYNIGGANFTQLLNAEVTTNQALINKLQAQSLKLSDTVALFQSLGGGWW